MQLSAPPGKFTKETVSSDQTFVSAGLLTMAHGLGVKPKAIRVQYVCSTAEFGYAIGDVIDITPGYIYDGTNKGQAIYADNSNVYVRMTNAATIMDGVNLTTGAAVVFTAASWKLRYTFWA